MLLSIFVKQLKILRGGCGVAKCVTIAARLYLGGKQEQGR